MRNVIKIILIIVGTISLILGTIGIALPVLPTTPFILLAAACFIRSSSKVYNWLIRNRLLGKIIENYTNKNGITLATKIYALSVLWISIIVTVLLFTDKLLVRVVILTAAFCVTVYLLNFKTYYKNENIKYNEEKV